MSTDVDELTVSYEEDGIEIVKEIDKVVLSKGAWATVLYRFKQWEKSKDDYSEDKYIIRRYQKVNGEYRVKSKFTISSKEQAQKIVNTLSEWLEN